MTIHAFANSREIQSSLFLSPVLHSWEKLHFLAIEMTFYYKSKNIYIFFSLRQPIEIIHKFALRDMVVLRKLSCNHCHPVQGAVHAPTKIPTERTEEKSHTQGHTATRKPRIKNEF